ncbi:MAG: HAMP domain-containing histidine kinase [Gammaproteobacteria bacterium]|nr:HAMP domain-containing histidine kinase [Gammaproteobacteria bacterium]
MHNSQFSFDPIAALNLQRLFMLRNIAIVCELAAVTIVTQVLAISLPLIPLAVIIAIHAVINVMTFLRIKRPQPVSSSEFFVQQVLDTLILTALLYFAGGSTNPFVSLFLLPLVIAAAILPQSFAWAMAALTAGCYTLLMFFYLPLPNAHLKHDADFDLHVLGMWFGFLLTTGLIVFFVVRMANSLRERDRILTEAREQALRDQHLVALGTLATGAAHELGTPLATMAVLASELKYDHATNADVVEKAEMLRGQLSRCKSILSDITASAGQARPEGGSGVAINDYLETVVKLLRSSRPHAKIFCQLNGSQPPPQILADRTLTQALINILNNAADASIDNVEVEGCWDSERLSMAICDRGEGLSPMVLAAAGTPFFTTKPDGQGLGLYLARAVMDRFGGQVQMLNREGGGTQVLIELPFSTIGVPS